MTLHPQAGEPADPSTLIDVDKLVAAYHDEAPDPGDSAQRVAFGTAGHRGSSDQRSFNDAHVAAMAAAVARYRHRQGVDGPLFLGRDTHALSGPAERTAREVLSAAGVEVVVDSQDRPVPTPAISHAILSHNRGHDNGRADGVVLTPSHNPPGDGGFKYNPPHGGPADVEATGWIEGEANGLLGEADRLPREPIDRARAGRYDFVAAYVNALPQVIDVDAIRASGLRLGVDPLGGATLDVWRAVGERLGVAVELVNERVDPAFAFMRRDHDGALRMDCSSPFAMAGVVAAAGHYDLGFGNDPDGDRHGIVAGGNLMRPNDYLAVAIAELFGGLRRWGPHVAVGKTVVSSSMIDAVAADLGRRLVEVPVGFKWFVEGLSDGTHGFAGEESAGASLLRRDGSPWTTDKDGVVLCLLAAEIAARSGRDPAAAYTGLTAAFGTPVSARVDVAASREQRRALKGLSADAVTAGELAGEPITTVLSRAPGNGEPIGGLKVVVEGGWFAARPSGTEDVYKLYAESWRGHDHLQRLVDEASEVVTAALAQAGA
jgi:phosphoglucomutase